MWYLEYLTRTTQSPAIYYHQYLLERPTFHKKNINPFKQAHLADILADIEALEADIAEFEKKYHRSSEQIYRDYMEGKEPEDDNFILAFGEWASIYQMWLVCQDEYFKAYQEQLSTYFPIALAA